MSSEVYVTKLPSCDLHFRAGDTVDAAYDGKTKWGPWAHMCEEHMASDGVGLGTGKGQRLIVGEKPERTREDIHADVRAAVEAGDYDALQDAVGDGDIADWL